MKNNKIFLLFLSLMSSICLDAQKYHVSFKVATKDIVSRIGKKIRTAPLHTEDVVVLLVKLHEQFKDIQRIYVPDSVQKYQDALLPDTSITLEMDIETEPSGLDCSLKAISDFIITRTDFKTIHSHIISARAFHLDITITPKSEYLTSEKSLTRYDIEQLKTNINKNFECVTSSFTECEISLKSELSSRSIMLTLYLSAHSEDLQKNAQQLCHFINTQTPFKTIKANFEHTSRVHRVFEATKELAGVALLTGRVGLEYLSYLMRKKSSPAPGLKEKHALNYRVSTTASQISSIRSFEDKELLIKMLTQSLQAYVRATEKNQQIRDIELIKSAERLIIFLKDLPLRIKL